MYIYRSAADEKVPMSPMAAGAEVATETEVRAWYMFDWANSPYFQVFVSCLGPILLKWLAEDNALAMNAMNVVGDANTIDLKEYALRIPGWGITAGSYPVLTNWITFALQVVCLLSFSALGDYGDRRLKLMKILTYTGSCILVLFIFCAKGPEMWWIAGLLRIAAGVCFVMAAVYYNAFMPLLVTNYHELKGLDGKARLKKELEVSDMVSARGQLWGYAGGVVMLIISLVIVTLLECEPASDAVKARTDPGCTPYERFLPPCACIALVGVWWTGFSLYTFRHLKERAGPPMPADANVFSIGFKEAWSTAMYCMSQRDTAMFMLFYFVSSDAISTTTNVALLLLEEGCPQPDGQEAAAIKLSAILMNSIVAALGCFLGIFAIRSLQGVLKASTKSMVMGMLFVYAAISTLGGLSYCKVATAQGGLGFYMLMAPLMLMLGPFQAYSRSLFSNLVPEGKESAMFAFFELTDKGSNLIGAMAIFLTHNATGRYEGTFWYLAFAFGSCLFLMYTVDFNRGMAMAGKGDGDLDEESDASEASD